MHYYEFIVLRFLATSRTWAIYKRRGPGLLHVLWQCLPLIHSCNKEGTWPSSCLVQKVRTSLRLLVLMHVHVLKIKKIPYRIWTLMRTNKFSLSRCGRRGDWHWLRRPGGRPCDRAARMIVHVITMPDVAKVEDLDAIFRGEGGFGSSGVWTLSLGRYI